MTSQLDTVMSYLTRLHGYAYFRPEAGPLKERLRQAVLDGIEGEYCEELAENPFDLEVSVGLQEGDEEYTLAFKVDHPRVAYRSQLAVVALAELELEDLARHLAPMVETPAVDETAPTGKSIVRKKLEEGEHHEKESAAARLKVTPEWLKSVIPCTDYSYEEIEGRKYIREYYWSRELIERLFKIKCSKTTPEDLQYVATECCDGDLDWAKDLIGRLKSPNRPEAPLKEQPQKGQGKPQVKVQPSRQHQHQQKFTAKPAQGQGAAPAKPAQEKGGAGTPPAEGAPKERSRSRSRHRKFRQQGKDGSRKPDAPGEQKQP